MPLTSRSDQLRKFLTQGIQLGADGVDEQARLASQGRIAQERTAQMNALRQDSMAERAESRKLREQQFAALEEQRKQREKERYSQAIDKSGLPEALPAIEGVEDYQGKSNIPVVNLLPNAVQGVAANIKGHLGDLLGKPEWQGAGEEYQKMQRLTNIDIKNMSGVSVPAHEEGRKMVEQGMRAGSLKQVQLGIKQMKDAALGNAQNIRGGFGGDVADSYEKQGGLNLTDFLKGNKRQTAGAPPPPADGTVLIIAPNGKQKMVPESMVDAAIAAGGRRAN